MIPYGRQDITSEDIDSVIQVLKSDFIAQGPAVTQFERAVSEYCGANYAVAVNSATSALHLACLALGIGKGDWLWTSPNTFVASANCGLYCNANIGFVDIDSRTYNMSVESLSQKLIKAEKEGKLPKIVIPVHFAGQSCEMSEIHKLSMKYGFRIIEDASHAIGGKYRNEAIGNCRYSDISIFSFHPVKIITTAEGGMVMTNKPELADKVQRLRSHGITREPEKMDKEPDGAWYYQQIELGYNYRMTDIQAALGYSQLNRLDHYVEQRHKIKQYYDNKLSALPITLPWQHPDNYSSLHLYPIQINKEKAGKNRKQVFDIMRNAGIGVNVHYIPVHLQPYYKQLGFSMGDFPNAEAYYEQAISLPMFPALTEVDQTRVIDILGDSLT